MEHSLFVCFDLFFLCLLGDNNENDPDVLRCTVGLAEKFGKERVFNTPLCEQVLM